MKNAETQPLGELLDNAQLAALPQSAIRLIQLSQNPENGPAEFAVPIESDPGLTAQILRFVNSSYFGFRHEVSSVRVALSLVGIRTIKNFVLWSAVFGLMPNPKCGPFDLLRLWHDSLRRAVFARNMAKLLAPADAEDLFAASLLQDIAVPLLARELPEIYVELLGSRDGGRKRLSDLERDRFGWTHADAGGMLALRWGLPKTLASLIATHVEPDRPSLEPYIGRIVPLSALLPSSGDEAWYDCAAFASLFAHLRGARQLAIAEVLECADRDFRAFAPALKLELPIIPLTEMLASAELPQTLV